MEHIPLSSTEAQGSGMMKQEIISEVSPTKYREWKISAQQKFTEIR